MQNDKYQVMQTLFPAKAQLESNVMYWRGKKKAPLLMQNTYTRLQRDAAWLVTHSGFYCNIHLLCDLFFHAKFQKLLAIHKQSFIALVHWFIFLVVWTLCNIHEWWLLAGAHISRSLTLMLTVHQLWLQLHAVHITSACWAEQRHSPSPVA